MGLWLAKKEQIPSEVTAADVLGSLSCCALRAHWAGASRPSPAWPAMTLGKLTLLCTEEKLAFPGMRPFAFFICLIVCYLDHSEN